MEMLAQIVEQDVDALIFGIFRHRLLDKLCLAALAMWRHNHPSGNLIRHRAAKTLADDVQAAIQRSGGACRGNNTVVIYVQRVDIQMSCRKAGLKILLELPVRSRPFAIQQTGVAEDKRTRA